MDEATSSIDVRGEQKVQAALDKASINRTTLVIAHRLSTVRKADNIIVLRKGKVVQQGTHDNLMAQGRGAYWALATAQQLMTSEEHNKEDVKINNPEITEKKSTATIATDTTLVESTATLEDDPQDETKARGFWGSFVLLFCEQKHRRKWYIILLLSALGGGGMTFSVAISSLTAPLSNDAANKPRFQPASRSRHTCLQMSSAFSSSGEIGFRSWQTFGV